RRGEPAPTTGALRGRGRGAHARTVGVLGETPVRRRRLIRLPGPPVVERVLVRSQLRFASGDHHLQHAAHLGVVAGAEPGARCAPGVGRIGLPRPNSGRPACLGASAGLPRWKAGEMKKLLLLACACGPLALTAERVEASDASRTLPLRGTLHATYNPTKCPKGTPVMTNGSVTPCYLVIAHGTIPNLGKTTDRRVAIILHSTTK